MLFFYKKKSLANNAKLSKSFFCILILSSDLHFWGCKGLMEELVMKQVLSLMLMVFTGGLLIIGSEYGLSGNYRTYHHKIETHVSYHQHQAVIAGRTKRGMIVTAKAAHQTKQTISNKEDGKFEVRLTTRAKPQQVQLSVPGLKSKTIKLQSVPKS